MTTIDTLALAKTDGARRGIFGAALSPNVSRLLLILFVAAASVSGFLIAGKDATSLAVMNDGEDLTRLLRAMAALKAFIAACAAAAVIWRLGSRVSPAWFTAYALACCAMGAGPGLIWGMAYVGTGALLLHGGLLASLLLIWRDPVVAKRLSGIIAARRHSIRSQSGLRSVSGRTPPL